LSRYCIIIQCVCVQVRSSNKQRRRESKKRPIRHGHVDKTKKIKICRRWCAPCIIQADARSLRKSFAITSTKYKACAGERKLAGRHAEGTGRKRAIRELSSLNCIANCPPPAVLETRRERGNRCRQ